MNTPRDPVAHALTVLVACGMLFSFVSCKAKAPDAGDELAGVTQFVANGSFEEMDGEKPKGWTHRSWQRGSDAKFGVGPVDSGPAARSGDRCVMISSENGADASWVTTVPIRPYSRYKLSGWIKTENLVPGTSRGAQINIDGEGEWRTPPVTGTQDWTRVEAEFDAGANDAVSCDLPLRRLGPGDGQGLVRRRRARAPLRPRPGTAQGHDRRRKNRPAHVQVHLRPVHRTLGPLHLSRHLGRDARGPEVLLGRRRGGNRPGRPSGTRAWSRWTRKPHSPAPTRRA